MNPFGHSTPIVGGVQEGHQHVQHMNHASKGIGKSMALGGGGRFAKLAKKTSPALAAFVGRKKYGATKMAKMDSIGRKRAM